MTSPTLRDLAVYFLRLGATGFGGPAALADRMRQDLVERRHWVAPHDFDLGLTIAAACPGPLAYQLAVYCGYVRHRITGAFVVGLTFAAAPFALVVAIAAFYQQWSDSGVVRGLFYGASPVIVVLIARACTNLARKTMHRAPVAWLAGLTGAVATWMTGREPLWVFALAGIAGVIALRPAAAPGRRPVPPPARHPPAALLALPLQTLSLTGASGELFLFFFKTGCLVFGSGLVIVPMLHRTVVQANGWLTEAQFLDAVTVGLVSPGPVVITATFVGYVVDRLPGAVAATAGMFLPAILFTVLAAPWFERHRTSAALTGFVRGITAAVVGVLAGTVPLVALTAVSDAPSVVILAGATVLAWRRRPVPDPVLVLAGAACGLILTVARS